MEKLIIQYNNETIIIPYYNIMYLASDGRYTTIHAINKKYVVCRNIGLYCHDLPPALFARVHKQYIVNLQKIEKVSANIVTLTDQITLPISRRRHSAIQELINTLIKNNN